ncbi:Na+/H+ antiporter NhaC [Halalkalibaculum sp. DA3122]|uniref:Na+/H+ antiporter NhaC n=1 Tax=unclassified Halalkalibaculum TaxID=2964617 RepID=UPI00375408D1
MDNDFRLPTKWEVIAVMILILAILFFSLAQLQLPIQLALFACWFIVIGLGIKIGFRYSDMQHGLVKGIYSGLDAALILIGVGALIGSWIAGGIVPSIIYYGLSIMNKETFLASAFIICGVTSLTTGTSFGTVGTVGIAMMGIGQGFGFSLPLVAGSVISGAYLGDKLSPLSDTTIMTASLCQVGVIDHVKSMLYISIPAAGIAFVLFLIAGFNYGGSNVDLSQATLFREAISTHFNTGIYLLLPAVVVIVLLVFRLPSLPVITFGALLGVVCAGAFQNLNTLDSVRSLYSGSLIETDAAFINTLLNRGGIESMYGVIVLIMFALGLGGLMRKVGILQVIGNQLLAWADTVGKLTTSTILSGFFGNFFGGAAYVSLITASTLTEKRYSSMGIDRRVLSRNTEAGGTVTTPMVPWTDGGIFMATTLGVSTISYLPFLWYNILVLLIAIIFGQFNIAIWYTEPE